MATLELIKQYGKALRDWYQNQHNKAKCDLANRLQRRIERIHLSDEEIDAFMQEHYSTTYLTPTV